ncbi:MAG: M67 family metallopeptidase [Chloroflexi bacterium]|nr:M67 family metallopeptidase [Chloroflexota bacterium]
MMMKARISYEVARQIADHARSQLPCEACGLLAGTDAQILAAHPMRNMANSPRTQFQLDPREQLQALKAIDQAQLDWIGVYHSHPRSAPIPSQSDMNQCADSGLLQLIVSLERLKPQLKLWRVDRDSAVPIELVYATEKTPDDEPALSPSQQAAIVIVAVAAVLILLIISFTLLPPAPDIRPTS